MTVTIFPLRLGPHAVVGVPKGDGTGRHTGLKILGSKGRVGSIPTLGSCISYSDLSIKELAKPFRELSKHAPSCYHSLHSMILKSFNA